MCGIFGFNWKNNKLLLGGIDKLKHRGPDDSGIFNDGKVSLGHSRLSIIDLSKSGKQPMSNEDKSIWITFNGEIYNYKELKKSLDKKHIFNSNTDTEVLVHLYEEEGYEVESILLSSEYDISAEDFGVKGGVIIPVVGKGIPGAAAIMREKLKAREESKYYNFLVK